MSKNITIQEGDVARTFSGVNILVTNTVGGGTQNWIPEDEANQYVETGELSVNENGTYNSTDDGYVGYSLVDVNIQPDLTTKSITENGIYNASDDGADGYSRIEVNVEGGGGGGGETLIEKSITANGTYLARDDDADGYSKVDVNIAPGGLMPSTDSYGNQWGGGTACLSILQSDGAPKNLSLMLSIY